MNSNAINLQFDEDKRAGIEQDWTKWWAGELGRPIVSISSAERSFFSASQEFTTKFLLEIPVDDVLDRFQPRLESTRYYADALPLFRPWFGPAGISHFLGGRMRPVAEHRTVWTENDEPTSFVATP